MNICLLILVNREMEENDEKYLMSLVQVNSVDRPLITDPDKSTEEFATRLNLQGRFIHVDSKSVPFSSMTSE